MFKQRSALTLLVVALFITAAGDAVTTYVRRHRFHPISSHVIFTSISGNEFTDPETYYHYQFESVKDQTGVVRLFVMIERHFRSTRPSQPAPTFTIKSSMVNPSDNGFMINDREQPLNPGLNVYYFGPNGYGPVQFTPDEARRITNADHWTHDDIKDFATILSKRVASPSEGN